MAELVKGDLLKIDVDCIVQQCNRVTVTAHGLSQSIKEKYKYADLYSKRTPYAKGKNCSMEKDREPMGSVVLMKPNNDKNESGPVVACLIAQHCPGKPEIYSKIYGFKFGEDSAQVRFDAFIKCLENLESEALRHKWRTIAFPFQIGCGLAGHISFWPKYENAIQKFATSLKAKNAEARVLIVRLS